MELNEIVEMCRVIFATPYNTSKSFTLIDNMVNFAKNGKIPFKVKPIIDEDVFDNSKYDLGVVDLGEYMIYDSLITGRGKDVGDIVMKRYLRLTKGSGENERELIVEL